jgi:hypothetical protein
MNTRISSLSALLLTGVALTSFAYGQNPPAPTAAKPTTPVAPDFPPASKVLAGFEKIVSTSDGQKSFYTLWRRKKDQQIYAELPKDFAKQRHFIALTVASGESYAGLQAGDGVFYWRKYNKRIALIEPNLKTKSTGDPGSKASVARLFTDKVLIDLPIVTVVPKGGPVIDLNALLVGQAGKFFGSRVAGLNPKLHRIITAKAFPKNIEVAFEVPMKDGQLRTLHYSISLLPPADPKATGYTPRVADERVGYFTTSYVDFGKFTENETRVRYINRWNLQKADPKLKLSPPKTPIVFYIEHTTPIRYRRWVRQGIEMWNTAFEKIGLINAIEVRQQDAASKAYMDLDPEDVRYNFVRWLSNGAGTAIGPSRVHPETGQILDADIILTDGWIRHWWTQYNDLLPKIAVEGMAPETMDWLVENPSWDPRVLLAPPRQRAAIRAKLTAAAASPSHPLLSLPDSDNRLLGDHELDGLLGRQSQRNGVCNAANCKTHGLASMSMMLDIIAAEGGDPENPDEQMIDGIPENFIGPLMADLTVHEVGHTLGLRHNFKGSSIYSLSKINSDEVIGKEALSSSVMDYIPVNMILARDGKKQGDYGMIKVGPYDNWAIEYGYTFDKDLKPVLAKVADPRLQYATDEDTGGPDPLARRYDFSANPLDYAKEMMAIVREHRGKLLEKFVKDGQSWSRARRGYLLTVSSQARSVSMMADWIGGAHVYRHRKGDPNGKAPIEVVPAKAQREALAFVIENSFRDEAYGLTPELLKHMTIDKWWDDDSARQNPVWPVHDKVLGLQGSALTYILNPTTLGRVYDNEFRVPSGEDALTLPELMDTIDKSVWTSLDKIEAGKKYTARQPLISSFQRNLQREYLDRLMGLTNGKTSASPAQKPVSDLAALKLESIRERLDAAKNSGGLDPYSKAHLTESAKRITKSLEARYVIQK